MVVPDPMLLTLRSPAKNEFEFSNSLHDFPAAYRTTSSDHYQPQSKQQASYSPSLEERKDHRPSSSVSDFLSVALAETPKKMTTPHRGLPPPGQLTLPDPSRPSHPPQPPPAPPQQYAQPSLVGLPAPPPNWQSTEEMRNWLATKAEEEKRKAEEERSRQEQLRLERRKVEQNMLMESIRSGVPPYLIPFFFLGLQGGLSPEWIQQYLAQIASGQPPSISLGQSVPGNSPEAGRSVLPSGYPVVVQPQQPSQTVPQTPVTGPGNFTFPVAQRPGSISDPAAGQPRGPFPTTILPRLATSEMHQMHGGTPMGSAQPSAGAQQAQEQSSPIHFHHWQPPATTSASTSSVKEQAPATPSDYNSSPKKRKATGSHQAAPAPSRAPDSATTSSNRRVGHSRHRSDMSLRAIAPDGAPRTPMDRQETPTQQQWHHHHAPASGGSLPPPPTLGGPGPSEGSTPFDSRRSSQPQILGSGAQTTPASDDRVGTSEDIEMGERS